MSACIVDVVVVVVNCILYFGSTEPDCENVGSGEKKEKEKEVIEKEVAAADEVAAEDCEYET